MRSFIFNIVFGAFEGILIYLLNLNSLFFLFFILALSVLHSRRQSDNKKALFLENRAL